MASREVTMNRSMRYGTRMLKAGEPVVLPGPDARLFEALEWAGPSARVRVGKPAHSRPPERDPLDHDGNGRRGGSAKGAASTRAKGKARAAAKKAAPKARKAKAKA